MLFKRTRFGLQKDSFWCAKGVLLESKRGRFGMQKESFCEADVSLWLCKD